MLARGTVRQRLHVGARGRTHRCAHSGAYGRAHRSPAAAETDEVVGR